MDQKFKDKETEMFIHETNKLVEELKEYSKSNKAKPEDIKADFVALTRYVHRIRNICDKSIIRQQAIKLVREFKKFEDLVPEFKGRLPDVPPESELDEEER